MREVVNLLRSTSRLAVHATACSLRHPPVYTLSAASLGSELGGQGPRGASSAHSSPRSAQRVSASAEAEHNSGVEQ